MDVKWRKAARSDANGGNCVELARIRDRTAVRDSKNPQGPILKYDRRDWAKFLVRVKRGEMGL
jgi:hypothetical protein